MYDGIDRAGMGPWKTLVFPKCDIGYFQIPMRDISDLEILIFNTEREMAIFLFLSCQNSIRDTVNIEKSILDIDPLFHGHRYRYRGVFVQLCYVTFFTWGDKVCVS